MRGGERRRGREGGRERGGGGGRREGGREGEITRHKQAVEESLETQGTYYSSEGFQL